MQFALISPIEKAAFEGDFPLFMQLYEAGESLSDDHGIDIYHIAAAGVNEEGCASIISYLLKKNVDPCRMDSQYGKLPFHFAAEKEHLKIMDIFLRNNINPNIQDAIGRSGLQILIESQNCPQAAAWLITHGGKLNSYIELPATVNSVISSRPNLCIQSPDGTVEDIVNERESPRHTFSNWKEIVANEAHNDMYFTIEDKVLYTNRMLIAEHSPYFSKFINEPFEETKQLPIPTSYSSMYCTLEWVYTGKIETNDLKTLFFVWGDAVSFGMAELQRYTQVDKIIPLILPKFSADFDEEFLIFIFQVFVHFIHIKKARYVVRFTAAILLQNISEVYEICCVGWQQQQLAILIELLYRTIALLVLPRVYEEIDNYEAQLELASSLGKNVDNGEIYLPRMGLVNHTLNFPTESKPKTQGKLELCKDLENQSDNKCHTFYDMVAKLFNGLVTFNLSSTDKNDIVIMDTPKSILSASLTTSANKDESTCIEMMVNKPIKYFWKAQRIIRFEGDLWKRIDPVTMKVKQSFLYNSVKGVKIYRMVQVYIRAGRQLEVYYADSVEDAQTLAKIINDRIGSNVVKSTSL